MIDWFIVVLHQLHVNSISAIQIIRKSLYLNFELPNLIQYILVDSQESNHIVLRRVLLNTCIKVNM